MLVTVVLAFAWNYINVELTISILILGFSNNKLTNILSYNENEGLNFYFNHSPLAVFIYCLCK